MEGLVVGYSNWHLMVYHWLLLSTTLDHKFHDFSALGQLLNPALV